MPLDFPASPITGATYTAPNGTIWVWDGAKWANGVYIGTAYAPINAPTFTGDARAVTPAAGDADTSVATTAFVSAAVAPAFNDAGRNLLHNPLFAVAQRGAGPWTAPGYTADRWLAGGSLDTISFGIGTLSTAAVAQIGDETANRYMSNTFTGNAGAGAANWIEQRIEGVRRLSGKTVIVSLWIYGSAGQKLGLNAYQSVGTGGSPSGGGYALATGISFTTTATFTRVSATIALPSLASATLGTNGDDYTLLRFYFSSGATNNVLAGNIGVQSGTIALWGVQLEVGSVATPLEKPDPQHDLAKCQRFYQLHQAVLLSGYNTAAGNFFWDFSYNTAMRAAPTVTYGTISYSNATGLSLNSANPTHAKFQVGIIATGAGYAIGDVMLSAEL